MTHTGRLTIGAATAALALSLGATPALAQDATSVPGTPALSICEGEPAVVPQGDAAERDASGGTDGRTPGPAETDEFEPGPAETDEFEPGPGEIVEFEPGPGEIVDGSGDEKDPEPAGDEYWAPTDDEILDASADEKYGDAGSRVDTHAETAPEDDDAAPVDTATAPAPSTAPTRESAPGRAVHAPERSGVTEHPTGGNTQSSTPATVAVAAHAAAIDDTVAAPAATALVGGDQAADAGQTVAGPAGSESTGPETRGPDVGRSTSLAAKDHSLRGIDIIALVCAGIGAAAVATGRPLRTRHRAR